jgi:carbon-monoxide dehydrogenase medium subunit
MKSQAFDYAKPASLSEVFALLKTHGDRAQILAGGQSLMPVMNLRMADPELLIDINGLPGLGAIELQGEHVRIGALVTHRQVQDSPMVAQHLPLLAAAVPHVAHVAIRNRGTIGGSLALADPAAEYPAVVLALGATVIAAGAGGERRIAARDFFLGLYQTALKEGEVIIGVEFPRAAATQRFAFSELARRHGDYAMIGLGATLTMKGSAVDSASLAFFALGDRPRLAHKTMAALAGKPLDKASIETAQQALASDLEPSGDLQADGATKLHLARVLLGRALEQMRTQP